MKAIVGAQILKHVGSERNHSVLQALALADAQQAVLALDVVNGQRKTFGKAQSATIYKLDGNAVSAQSDVAKQ